MSRAVHDELLARLARLDATDRAWLLGELPPTLRRELVEILSEDPTPAAPAAAPPDPPGWENLPPEHVADALEREPVWLVSAATRAAETRWRGRLLQSMSSRRRHEVEMADRAGGALAARAARSVLANVRARIEGGGARAAAPRSKFATLVDQMRSRRA